MNVANLQQEFLIDYHNEFTMFHIRHIIMSKVHIFLYMNTIFLHGILQKYRYYSIIPLLSCPNLKKSTNWIINIEMIYTGSSMTKILDLMKSF